MIRKTAALIVLALMTTAAAPKHPARKPPASPASRPPPAVTPGAARIDARDPAAMIALLGAAGAKAQVARKEPDAILLAVTSTMANFSVQYAQCDAQGRSCKAALLDSQAAGAPTLAQINDFNQASAMCRGYLDKAGKAHVVMSMLLFADQPRDNLVTAMAAWQGCLADFASFAKDPVSFLANAA
jgi:hypothetical protein